MKFQSIVAIDRRRGFSYKNRIPWKPNKYDMISFKLKTKGNIVIMGRRTYESLPGPLGDRYNIVVGSISFPGVKCVDTFEKAVAFAKTLPYDSCYFIGGESIYRKCMDMCDVHHVTFHNEYDGPCDKFYPPIPKNFAVTTRDKYDYISIVEYTRQI